MDITRLPLSITSKLQDFGTGLLKGVGELSTTPGYLADLMTGKGFESNLTPQQVESDKKALAPTNLTQRIGHTIGSVSPGMEAITPGLKKAGVPGGLAFGIGLGVDVLTPGPGELGKVDDLVKQAKKYKSAEEFVKVQTKSNSWSEAQKANPDLWNTGILRKSQAPYKAKGEIPIEVHSAQAKWQNYGQNSEIPASQIYDKTDNYGYYLDKEGNTIRDINGNALQNNQKFGGEDAMVSNQQLKDNLLQSFETPEGKKYLNEVVKALPKNPDGSITAYRIGSISGDGVQSYTLSEGMAKTFSNQGTDIPLPGTPGLPKGGYKDFGVLPANMVKIDPKGIKAWSPYDAEILVEPKYVQTKSQLTDLWNKTNLIPQTIEELMKVPKGVDIKNPQGLIPISKNSQFTRRSFKHFLENRTKAGNTREEIDYLISKAPEVTENPELSIKNPNQNYPDSTLLGRYYDDSNKAVMTVLDKGGDVRDIISLHFKKRSDFEELKKLYGQ